MQMLKDKYDSFSHIELKSKFSNTIDYWKNVSAKGGSVETNTNCIEVNELSLPILVKKNYNYYKNILNDHQFHYLKSL
jgi:hypothetical protein